MALDWIAMNVIAMVREILGIANPVVAESALPDLSFSTENSPESMGIAALGELNGMFEGNGLCGSDQQMYMLGHNHEGMQKVSPLPFIAIQSLQKQSRVAFDNKKSAALPSREGYEISSGRGDEPSRLQGQTSAAESRVLC